MPRMSRSIFVASVTERMAESVIAGYRRDDRALAAGDCLPGAQPLPYCATLGEVTERLKVHAWKVCVR